MKWFADNSEFYSGRKAKIPDVLVFGGIGVDSENELKLCNMINEIKRKYKCEHWPLKWNFKDLKKYYENNKKQELYNDLLKRSKEWRENIFNNSIGIDYKIIISIIESHSKKRDILKSHKAKITEYSFSNWLQRVSLCSKELKQRSSSIHLDWPDGNQKNIFDEEYCSAYVNGMSKENKKYFSGSLRGLGFQEYVSFSSTEYCNLLQMSDLIDGLICEVIKQIQKQNEGSDCFSLLETILPKFRNKNGKIISYGLIVSPGQNDILEQLRSHFTIK